MLYLTTLSTYFIYGYMASNNGKGPLSKRDKKPAAATT